MERKLFGGAMKIVLLDMDEVVDVSTMRQVPDNQECFVSADAAGEDRSVIVEILEVPEDVESQNEGAQYYWNDLAEANEAIEQTIIKSDAFESLNTEVCAMSVALLVGTQAIPKFGKTCDLQQVKLYLSLLRIPSKNTDILISYYDPVLDRDATDNFRNMCRSLRIVDWIFSK
jgi:hypothetical protein